MCNMNLNVCMIAKWFTNRQCVTHYPFKIGENKTLYAFMASYPVGLLHGDDSQDGSCFQQKKQSELYAAHRGRSRSGKAADACYRPCPGLFPI